MNDIKIGIHHRDRSFSNYWIDWCRKQSVSYKLVNAYGNDIVDQLQDCDGFMWHWHHDSYADQLFARQLTLALESGRKPVFPSVATAWHFDDKVGQKYLLEATGLPLVPARVFYTKDTALEWLRTTDFPKVFKLRGGAASVNVRLVPNLRAAYRLVDQAFGEGFPVVDLDEVAGHKLWEFRRDRTARSLARAAYYFGSALLKIRSPAMVLRPRQMGYIYFQDFVPDNRFDDRLVVIGNRCFCVRRHCRGSDFRASGSGVKSYDHSIFPRESIKMAFKAADILNTQSLAVDIVYNSLGDPKLLEISYCFVTGPFYEDCDGYFDKEGKWHDKKVTPQIFMIEDFYESLIRMRQ